MLCIENTSVLHNDTHFQLPHEYKFIDTLQPRAHRLSPRSWKKVSFCFEENFVANTSCQNHSISSWIPHCLICLLCVAWQCIYEKLKTPVNFHGSSGYASTAGLMLYCFLKLSSCLRPSSRILRGFWNGVYTERVSYASSLSVMSLLASLAFTS